MKSILQSKEWAEFKKSQGFEIFELDGLYVHKRILPFGRNFLYIPEADASKVTQGHLSDLKKLASEQNSIFARLEISDSFSENSDQMLRALGFIKAFEEIQPKWRQIIDISKSEQDILTQMKPKGRYNIKVAQKHSVKITHGNENLKTFYSLYLETVKREGITGRSLQYFKNMVDKFKDTDYLEIYLATYQDEPVAGALITFCDGLASYMYGGSSRSHKEVMAPYLLHWQIIQDALKRGCTKYDLLGRTKPGKEGKWTGVTRFKEQLGGEAVEITGSYDFVHQPVYYKLFKFVEKMRRKNDN
jgi:lipid II:glycine glycyltransferase (peptidoglycan interpeptide bridge formation enzyme)